MLVNSTDSGEPYNELLGKVAVCSPMADRKEVWACIFPVNFVGTADMCELCVTKVRANPIADIERKKSGEVIMLTTCVEPRLHETSVHLNEFLSISLIACGSYLKRISEHKLLINLSIETGCMVSRIYVDYIRIARLLLQFRDFSFQIPRLDFFLANIFGCDHNSSFFCNVAM